MFGCVDESRAERVDDVAYEHVGKFFVGSKCFGFAVEKDFNHVVALAALVGTAQRFEVLFQKFRVAFAVGKALVHLGRRVVGAGLLHFLYEGIGVTSAEEAAYLVAVTVEDDEGGVGGDLKPLGQFHALALLHVNLDVDEARVHVRTDFLLRKHGVRHHLARSAPRRVAVEEHEFVRLLGLGHGVLEQCAFRFEGHALFPGLRLHSEADGEEGE